MPNLSLMCYCSVLNSTSLGPEKQNQSSSLYNEHVLCHFLLALQGILGGHAILVKSSPLQSTKTVEGVVILIEIETISG